MMTVSFGNPKNMTNPTSSPKQIVSSFENTGCNIISRGPTCRTESYSGGFTFCQVCCVQANMDISPTKVTERAELIYSYTEKTYDYPGQNPVIVCNSAVKVEDSASITPNPVFSGGASLSTGALIKTDGVTEDGVTGTQYFWAFTFSNMVEGIHPVPITVEVYMVIGEQNKHIVATGEYSENSQASLSWSSITNIILEIIKSVAST